MAHRLADLLGNNHPLFSYNVMQLEHASGNTGIDTRLLAEIDERANSLVSELGLDNQFASAEEIYHALNALDDGRRDELLAGADFVMLNRNGQVVSFNIRDVTENEREHRSFAERDTDHAKRSLRNELLKRYIDSDRTDNQIVQRLIGEAGIEAEYPREDHENTEGENSHTPRFLLIGDIISDAFIKLNEEFVKSSTDDQGYQRISMELGAKIPYDEVEIVKAVECSPNAAVSVSRLGIRADLMSWIGDDEVGREMIEHLEKEGVHTEEFVVEPGKKSNYHYVLRYGADRTKLQKFEDYSYEWRVPKHKPDWIYLGVLGEKTWPLHEQILAYLNENPDIKLAFQPGMYHLMWGAEKMADFYRRAEIVIMNREEAAQVTGRDRGDLKQLIWSLHDMGVNVPVITDGPEGAYASAGNGILFMPNYPDPKPPLDRTGAGDAFASTIVAALALGKPLEDALRWAPINSMSVVQQMGAQAGLLKQSEVEEFLANAPEDYHSRSFE